MAAAAGAALRQPVIYLPHGGGPCFLLPDGALGSKGLWLPMKKYLEGIAARLPRPPSSVLVVSAHWEANVPTLQTNAAPPLLYDYYGFPAAAYDVKWRAKGDAGLCSRVRELLSAAGLKSAEGALGL